MNFVFFVFVSVVFLQFWVACLCVLVIFLILLLFISFLLWFLLWLAYVIFYFIPFVLRRSRLIVFAVVVFVLIPPLSHLLFFLSPPPPRAHLKRKTMEEQLSHFVCLSEILAKTSFKKQLFFSLVDFFRPRNMFCLKFLEFVLMEQGFVCFYLLFCCFGVCKGAFFRSNFSLVLALFGFVVFSVRVLLMLCVSACLVFLMGSGYFFQFSSSVWDCLFFIVLSWCCFFYFMSWLLVCLWNALGGSFGYGQHGGVSIFFGFSHSRGVRVKTFLWQFHYFKIMYLRDQNRRQLSMFLQETLQNRGFIGFFSNEKFSTLIYEIHVCYLVVIWEICGCSVWGVRKRTLAR